MEFTYKGLKAEMTRHIITDAEVDRQIQRLQQQNPRIAVVKDRPTENGDEVVLNYAGFCDGEQFPGGTAENQTLVLGSGMFIPGFEEQLLDKVPGEEVIVKVTFPKSYHAENLAGKPAEFHCKIQEIRVKTMYELDDVFAQEGLLDSFAMGDLQLKIRALSIQQIHGIHIHPAVVLQHLSMALGGVSGTLIGGIAFNNRAAYIVKNVLPESRTQEVLIAGLAGMDLDRNVAGKLLAQSLIKTQNGSRRDLTGKINLGFHRKYRLSIFLSL